MTMMYGDTARTWVSHSLRSFFATDCTLTWRGIYNVDKIVKFHDESELKNKSEKSAPLHPEIEETAEMFRHF